MKLARLAAIAILSIAFSGAALADSSGIDAPRINNMSVKQFEAFHAKLSNKLDSKPYEHVDNEKRREFDAAQSDIKAVLDGKQSMDDLTENERTKLFNAHERVVAVMNDAELDRMVCTREKKIGSHRGELVCRSQRQVRDERDAYKSNSRRTRVCQGGLGC